MSQRATDWSREWKSLAWIAGVLLLFWHLPVGTPRFDGAVTEALALTRWYAREHVLLCLVPAFFIAGAVSVFVNQASVMRYLGPDAPKLLSYGVASVSGTVLAVCSCTVLPLFGGIYLNGAGIGPATAFLYAGPAINVLAIILTARILGVEMGVARAVGAVAFSLLIGLLMHLLFRRSEAERARGFVEAEAHEGGRPLWQTTVFFLSMVGVLVFANWGAPATPVGAWAVLYAWKWRITAGFALALAFVLVRWMGMGLRPVAPTTFVATALALAFPERPLVAFGAGGGGLSWIASRSDGEAGDWFAASWGFAKQILPLLLLGVLAAGLLLGRPGHEGLVPSDWVAESVGGNSLGANLFASMAGAFMYFATLTEVPIIQGLMGSGMGTGPALALLLAGPALSLPSILVLRSLMGTRRTLAFLGLVVVMATAAGMLYGALR
ncbi:MAG: hypothetical protein FIA95_06900 [Gemmatimonadetes bacterium]|nr:hypothetical protein [Gemmatimonadota bacterium]